MTTSMQTSAPSQAQQHGELPGGTSRRTFIGALSLAALSGASIFGQALAPGKTDANADRELSWRVRLDGFGGAREADIRAVVRSAANEIWRHCPATRFEPAGFEIYHDSRYPITHYERAKDGFIVIGLAVEGNLWARFAYQFAHEFAHALIDHANDWRGRWREAKHANKWLEESLCETASLYVLGAMARTWSATPPYPNWRSYAPALADYAAKHLADPKRQLPEGRSFIGWFAAEEPGLREHGTQREKNTIVARYLLPLFEAEPRGWECLPSLMLGSRQVDKSLATLMAEWSANAPPARRPLLNRMAALFGLSV